MSQLTATVPRESAPLAIEALRRFAAERLRPWEGRERTVVLAVPAPLVEPEALFRVSRLPMGVLWDPPSGRSVAGVGVSHRIDLAGAGRFGQLRQAAEALWSRTVVEVHPGCAPPRPRLLGGLAFEAGGASEEPWEELGDGCFTLPRFTYVRQGEEATLAVAVRAESELSAAGLSALLDQLEELLGSLRGAAGAVAPVEVSGGGARVVRPPRREWTAAVEAIRAAIARGDVEKVVAARRTLVELERAIDPAAVLGRLAAGLRASTRFAFRRRRSTFLGATPERLIARRGLDIETEALAGSIASGGEHAAELLSSRKDLREHRLVLDEIVRRLEPLCRRLDAPAQIQIRALSEVLHLLTPVVGRLLRPLHVLELVELLHPTPAVGGVPAEAARRWIRSREAAPRGWYAGPIGWFDADGDGEFAVALRSCVIRGRRAFLYAGAGIVAGSEPGLEAEETELKEKGLLAALGAAEAPGL